MGSPASMPSKIDILESRLHDLETRLATVESQLLNSQPLDDLTSRILDFLNAHPRLKFNTGTIAVNVEENTMKVSNKMRTLCARGLVQSEKIEGRGHMYWAETPPMENGEG